MRNVLLFIISLSFFGESKSSKGEFRKIKRKFNLSEEVIPKTFGEEIATERSPLRCRFIYKNLDYLMIPTVIRRKVAAIDFSFPNENSPKKSETLFSLSSKKT